MTKKSSWISIIALVICGLIFAGALGYNLYRQSNDNKIVTPTTDELNNIDKEQPGVFADISGDDLEKIDVRRGFAVIKDTLYFVRNKSEAEIRAEITKQQPKSTNPNNGNNPSPTDETTTAPQSKIDPDLFIASQLMSWSSTRGVTVVADLTNTDKHPINRLSSHVENNNLFLFPCVPSQDPQIFCETSKVYQFDLTTSKLGLLNDFSNSPDKDNQIKSLNQKYHFDDLGQPYWQGIRGGSVFGIKNMFNLDTNSKKILTGYLVSTKDGITEKALVTGTQLAKSDLSINSRGNILIDQSGTLKESNTCVIEHRIIEINPDKLSDMKKVTVRKLNIDDKGNWNDGTTRTDDEQKLWAEKCASLPEYTGKTPDQLLQVNSEAESELQSYR